MNEHNAGDIPMRRKRWALYGINVVVLLSALLVIVVLVNWLAHRHYVRFDLTATRQYSLSAQTRQLLGGLKSDVRIITLFDRGSQILAETRHQQKQVNDLLTEYTRFSGGRIKVESLDSAYDAVAFDRLMEELCERYKDKTHHSEEALREALGCLADTIAYLNGESQVFRTNATRFHANTGDIGKFIGRVSGLLRSQAEGKALGDAASRVREALEKVLPDYHGAWSIMLPPMEELYKKVLVPLVAKLEQVADSRETDDAVRSFLRGRIAGMKDIIKRLEETIGVLGDLSATEYDIVRHRIYTSNSIILMTDNRVTVFGLDQIYVQPQLDIGDVIPERLFRGEEVITGGLVSLTIGVKPKVVLVNISPPDALGDRGVYSYVAEILQNMNFEVIQWNPLGDDGGQKSVPLPRAADGQRMVLVVLPDFSTLSQNDHIRGVGNTVAALSSHLNSGQPALVFVGPSPGARFGQADLIADVVKKFGIKVLSDRRILTEEVRGEARVASNRILVTRWPDEHVISCAVNGLTGLHFQPVSLDITIDANAEMKRWVICQTPADTWAELDWPITPTSSRGKNEDRGPFVTIAAAEKDEQRLVVIGDPMWAVDEITRLGTFAATKKGAKLRYAAFPANAEVFVNSIYWLAGLDELIAGSARTQDVRRFDPIDQSAMIAVWWITLCGVPVCCLAAGGMVWLMRRK